jgi:hypothetical protein
MFHSLPLFSNKNGDAVMRTLIPVLLGSVMLLSFSGTQSAAAPSPFPQCDSSKVIKKLVKRFNKTEKIYWSARGRHLNTVAHPHLHSENPFPDSPINRRYCHGDAVFSDGKKHRIHYLIEQGAGFAGFSWNVEYCIHGLDPWKYYDGRCRVLSKR